MKTQRLRPMRRRGFTLIELLTVMAISAILLGLIIVPLFQSFNLTRTAQAFADAQDRARVLTERISREIGNSTLVRGSGGLVATTLNGVATELPVNSVIIRVPRGNAGNWPGDSANPIEVPLPFTKIDLLLAAEGSPERGPGGGLVDPVTGKEDPTLKAPKGQVNLPAAPGAVMARYFVALRDPMGQYNNPYDGLLMARGAARDNLYSLFRAEVVPYVYRNNKNTPGDDSTAAYRPNLEFFQSDDATDSQILDLDDPRFILADIDGSGNPLTTGAKADRIRNWMAKATMQTDVSRYDMILPVFDKGSRRIRSVATDQNMPRIVPLIQFRPTRINSDPAEPMLAARPGEESDDANAVGSDVYQTQYALWGNAVLRVYPQGWSPQESSNNDYLIVHRSLTDATKPNSMYVYDPDTGPANDFTGGPDREVFDLYMYNQLSAQKGRYAGANRIYPFTQAALASNALSGWLGVPAWRALFTPVTYDRNKGRIFSSFGIDEVGNVAAIPTNARNLPGKLTGLELTPATDPDLTGNFYDAKFASINKLYNKLFNDYPSLRAGNVQRFVDLRLTPNSDGTPSPLDPRVAAGAVTGFSYLVDPTDAGHGSRSKVTIVPGSEVVFGPDQLPGPNYGATIRYTRAVRGEPGPNQYRINYTDLAEPTNGSGDVDYSLLYPDLPAAELGAFNPNAYSPTNLISAVIQPRFKAGYLQLYSGSDLPLPQGENIDTAATGDGEIRVYYRFQFTNTRTGAARRFDSPSGSFLNRSVAYSDTITVDYDTRQLMDVQLTIRNYPQSSVPNPQTVTLKSTATVRNFTR